MTVKRAKMEVGPLEFLQWQLKILIDEEMAHEKEWHGRSRSDYYMAQIASEIYAVRKQIVAVFTKPNMPNLGTTDLLIDFKTGDRSSQRGQSTTSAAPQKPKEKTIEEMTPEEILAKKKEISEKSRAAWGAHLGIKDPEGAA